MYDFYSSRPTKKVERFIWGMKYEHGAGKWRICVNLFVDK